MIVRAKFSNTDRVYHYDVPEGANVGDRIHSDGMYSPYGTVIGVGRRGYDGPCKRAKVIRRGGIVGVAQNTGIVGVVQTTGALKDVWTSETSKPMYLDPGLFARVPLHTTKEQRPMSHEYKTLTLDEQIAEVEKYAKDLRKKAKAAAKAERKRKAAAKERARVRKLALAALEDVAKNSPDAKARVEAADKLLYA